MAAFVGNVEIIELLLDAGAEIDAANNDGDTPLHYAARNGKIELVVLLLEAGADYSIKNNQGKTARELARENGFQKIDEFFTSY